MNRNANIRAALTGIGRKPMKTAAKETLFSELLSLLSSGLDFSHSFRLLIDGEKDRGVKGLLSGLYSDVVAGNSLWGAMERSGRFTPLDCGIVRIGEETGKLGESLGFLADYYRKKGEQARMVSSAVSYPLIILCVAVVVVVFMLAVIVPMFEQVYSRMGGELPALTRWIISVSERLPAIAAIVVSLAMAAAAALYAFREKEAVKRLKAGITLRLPLAGSIVKNNSQAHFCKLLYLITGSGVPLLNGVEMLQGVITFHPYRQSFAVIAGGLRKGESFADSLAKFPELYDRKLVSLLKVGEETNRLPDMLRKQGEDLTAAISHKLKQLGSLLEPILILLVGIMVAVILISMYMPMFRLGGVIG